MKWIEKVLALVALVLAVFRKKGASAAPLPAPAPVDLDLTIKNLDHALATLEANKAEPGRHSLGNGVLMTPPEPIAMEDEIEEEERRQRRAERELEEIERDAERSRLREARAKAEAEASRARLAVIESNNMRARLEAEKAAAEALAEEVSAREAEYARQIQESHVRRRNAQTKRGESIKANETLSKWADEVKEIEGTEEVFCGVDFNTRGMAFVWVFKRIGTEVILVERRGFKP